MQKLKTSLNENEASTADISIMTSQSYRNVYNVIKRPLSIRLPAVTCLVTFSHVFWVGRMPGECRPALARYRPGAKLADVTTCNHDVTVLSQPRTEIPDVMENTTQCKRTARGLHVTSHHTISFDRTAFLQLTHDVMMSLRFMSLR